MRSCFGIGFLLIVMASIATTDAAPPKTQPKASMDADQLKPGVFAGTVVSIPNPDRMFTVNVTYQKIQLKPGQNPNQANQNLRNEYNRIVQLQAQAMRPPGRGHNPMHAMQQLQGAVVKFQNDMARTQANMFQVVNATQRVDFQVAENVKVRMNDLPENFDEKGNIKRYTKEETAQFKGKDKNLPGYESSLDALKPGQIVKLALVVHKKPKSSSTSSSSPGKEITTEKAKAKETAKEAPKETPGEASVEHKLQVVTILILKDSDAPPAATNPGKNKKKK
jgi:hypothetical protein